MLLLLLHAMTWACLELLRWHNTGLHIVNIGGMLMCWQHSMLAVATTSNNASIFWMVLSCFLSFCLWVFTLQTIHAGSDSRRQTINIEKTLGYPPFNSGTHHTKHSLKIAIVDYGLHNMQCITHRFGDLLQCFCLTPRSLGAVIRWG